MDEHGPTRRLMIAYIAALSLIAILSGAVHVLLDQVIAQQRDSGTIINVAGRQRMLSQRIGLLARDLYQDHDASARLPLLTAAAAMERAHAALLLGSGDLGIVHGLSAAVRPLYFSPPGDLDRRTRDLILAARVLAGAAGPADGAPEAEAARRRAFAAIREESRDGILPSLDQAVHQFEAEGRERIEWLRQAQQGVLAILLTTLLAEAMFIFRPLVRRVRIHANRLHDLATRDTLTGLANRRHFLDLGRREWNRARQTGQPLAVLMVDIDHFKAINDTHGHTVGDTVLHRCGRVLAAALPPGAVAGRIGGEEFAVLLPDTDAPDARARAEHLRQTAAAAQVDGADGLTWTVSIGIASVQGGDLELGGALRRADLALHAAKAAGRNQVRFNAA